LKFAPIEDDGMLVTLAVTGGGHDPYRRKYDREVAQARMAECSEHIAQYST
jgi:hypothetical protein